MYEVHAFHGEATVDETNALGYEAGSRHPVIVFSRQDAGSPIDFALAARRAHDNGLHDVSFDDGGKLRPEAITSMPPEFADAYQSALAQGYGVVVYSEAVSDDS
jgi:hypothetical protein